MSAEVFKGFVGDKEREQAIYTPDYLLDCVDKVFPDGWCDPYPGDDTAPTTRRGHVIERGYWGVEAYANPPFKDLKQCLRFAHERNVQHNGLRSLVLCPHRTRTNYYAPLVIGRPIVYLKPVKFVGYKGTFPENLVVIGYGVDPACLRDAFAPHSQHFQEKF